MNQFVPDWSSNMGDAFAPLGGEDDGLSELLWCNGHVVMQRQAPRKPPRPEKAAAAMQEDEAAPWFQYAVDDSLEKDLFSELFSEMPAAADAGGKACKEECGAVAGGAVSRLMPPPRPAAHVAREKAGMGDVDDARGVSEVVMAQSAGERAAATEAGESSMLTIGSSICGSNQVQTPGAARARVVSDTACDSALPPPGNGKAGGARASHDATTVTSSSMRSRPCTAKTEPPDAANRSGGKRKQRDPMESGSPSEVRRGVRIRRRDVRAGAEADDGQTASRRRGAQPLGEEEKGQDQREDEGAAGAHTSLQQNGQGVDAGRGDRVPQVAAAPTSDDVDGRGHGAGAGDVPGGRAPVHAADGRRDGPAPHGPNDQDAAVHGSASGRAELSGEPHAGGDQHGRPLRPLPRRRTPAATVSHALSAGDELLPARGGEESAAEPGAAGRARRRLHGLCLLTTFCTKNTKIVARRRSRVSPADWRSMKRIYM